MQPDEFLSLVEAIEAGLANWPNEVGQCRLCDTATNFGSFSATFLIGDRNWAFDVQCSRHTKNRISISPRYEMLGHFLSSGSRPLGITVASTRGANAIVGDITRRFLPAFLELMQQCQEAADNLAEQKAKTQANVDAILAAVDGAIELTQKTGAAHGIVSEVYGWLECGNNKNSSLDVDVWPDSATIKMRNLPMGLVIEILELASVWREQG